MATPASISSVPTLDAEPALNEKAPVVIELTPAPETKAENEHSSSTSPVQPKSISEFEIEDHPINIPPKIRVSQRYLAFAVIFLTNFRWQS